MSIKQKQQVKASIVTAWNSSLVAAAVLTPALIIALV